jgi:hypothetical protein
VNYGETASILIDLKKFVPYTVAVAPLARAIAAGYSHHVSSVEPVSRPFSGVFRYREAAEWVDSKWGINSGVKEEDSQWR